MQGQSGDVRYFDAERWLSATRFAKDRYLHRSPGGMTKHGDAYVRTLLIHGARAVLRVTPNRDDATSRWAERLRRRRPDNVAAVALAAKHARIM